MDNNDDDQTDYTKIFKDLLSKKTINERTNYINNEIKIHNQLIQKEEEINDNLDVLYKLTNKIYRVIKDENQDQVITYNEQEEQYKVGEQPLEEYMTKKKQEDLILSLKEIGIIKFVNQEPLIF